MRRSHVLLTALAATAVAAAAVPAAADDKDDRSRQSRYHGRYVDHFMGIYDTTGDRKVRLNEITAEQKRLFGAVDLNGDGSLSVDEFRRRGRMLQTMGTTTIFDLLDTNGDRKISADELAAPSKRWFSRYDANNDGALSEDELPSRYFGRGPRRGPHRR